MATKRLWELSLADLDGQNSLIEISDCSEQG